MRRFCIAATAAVSLCGGVAAFAATQLNAVRVGGSLRMTVSHIAVKSCAGGFNATADATVRVSSSDPRLRGVMRLRLTETANPADDAYVTAGGGFFDSGTNARKGTVRLTAVDRGNDLNGIYVITLAGGRGVIVANTSSHQDTPTSAHGEIGSDKPLAPSNSAVLVSRRC